MKLRLKDMFWRDGRSSMAGLLKVQDPVSTVNSTPAD